MNDRQLHQIASALRAVACCATSDWSMLPRLPAVFLDVGHSLAVGAMRVRPAEVAELVRLDFHLDNLVASHCETVSLLRLELEPLIIGVGKVRVRDSTAPRRRRGHQSLESPVTSVVRQGRSRPDRGQHSRPEAVFLHTADRVARRGTGAGHSPRRHPERGDWRRQCRPLDDVPPRSRQDLVHGLHSDRPAGFRVRLPDAEAPDPRVGRQ